MYPVSDEYIAARRAPFKEERITGWIKLKDGTIIEINDSVVIQGSLKTIREVCSDSSFDIGTANCSKLTIKIKDSRAYDHEFGGALIKLKYGLVTATAEDGTKTWEDIPITPYYVDGSRTTRKRDLVYLTAFDMLSRLDVDVPDTIPTSSLYAALQYCCNRAGVGLAVTEDEFNELPNAGIIPDFSSGNIQTCRDCVMWIAQAVNCCCFCDYRGLLTLKQYRYIGGNNYDRRFSANERTGIEYSDTRTYLAYLQSYSGDDVKLYSNVKTWESEDAAHIKEGALSLPKNPLFKKLTAAQCDEANINYLNVVMRGAPTRFVKMTGAVDPAVEPLDVLAFYGGDIDVGQIISVATRICWVYHGKGGISCANVSENSETVSAGSAVSAASVSMLYSDTESEPAALSDTSEDVVTRPKPKSQIEKQLDSLSEQLANGAVAQKLQTGSAACSAVTSDSGLVIQGTEAQAVISPKISKGKQTVVINPGQGYPTLSLTGDMSDGGEMHVSAPYLMFDVTPQKLYYYGVSSTTSAPLSFEISGSAYPFITLRTDYDGLNIRWGSNDAYQIWLRGDYLDIRCNGQSLISMHTSGTFSIGVGTSQLRYDGINLTFGGKKILMED